MSDDIYIPDPSRIIRRTTTGDVQAWAAPPGDAAVNFSLYARVMHGTSEVAYTSQSLNLTVADARDLARVLIEAADHADKVSPKDQSECCKGLAPVAECACARDEAEGLAEGPPSGEAASAPVMQEARQDRRDDAEHARLFGRGGL